MSMEKHNHDFDHDKSNKNIEVWEDLVSIRDLLLSLFTISLTTMGGYFLAPNEPPKPLFFGLVGAFIGFILISLLIKPKRLFQEVESEE